MGAVMTETTHWIIETHDLTRIYGDGEQIRALDDVNLQCSSRRAGSRDGTKRKRQKHAVECDRRAGPPSSGKVLINGQDLTTIRNKDKFRAKTVGFVFQLHNLLPTLNAVENVEVPMMGHQSLLYAAQARQGIARAGRSG